MGSGRWRIWAAFGLFFPVLYWLNYQVERTDFGSLICCYLVLFALLGAVWYFGKATRDDKLVLAAGIAASIDTRG